MKNLAEIRYFLPAFAPFMVLVAGLWLIQHAHLAEITIEPPAFDPETIAGKEGLSRYWVALTLLVLIVVSVGSSVFAGILVFKSTSHKIRRLLFFATILALLALSLMTVSLLEPRPFYEYLGSSVFEATLGRYPETPGGLPMLDVFISFGNFFGILAAASLAAAVCVLIPDTSNAFEETSNDRQQAIDNTASEIVQQMRSLKFLLGAASLILLAGLVYMKAWREWPLAYWSNPETPGAIAFSELVDATITYQAGHFVLVLMAIFIPVAYRLKTISNDLAGLAHTALDPTVQQTWLKNKGLTLSLTEVSQRIIAIILPLVVPIAAETATALSQM